MQGHDLSRKPDRCLPVIDSFPADSNSDRISTLPSWPLSPPHSVANSEEVMKRHQISSTSPSPTGPSHTPSPVATSLPGRRDRIAIRELISPPAALRPLSAEPPLAFLPSDDPCVLQPFEVFRSYALGLPRHRDELHEIEQTRVEADSLIHDLAYELEKAENAKPRRARIIGPIRARLQSAETQKQNATEKAETVRARVVFSEDTMRAMRAVLLKFGWRIVEAENEGSQVRLQPHPDHPEARNSHH